MYARLSSITLLMSCSNSGSSGDAFGHLLAHRGPEVLLLDRLVLRIGDHQFGHQLPAYALVVGNRARVDGRTLFQPYQPVAGPPKPTLRPFFGLYLGARLAGHRPGLT